MNIEKRLAAVEKAMNAGGGHCHLIQAFGDEDADRKIAEVRKQDPDAKAFLVIIRSRGREGSGQ